MRSLLVHRFSGIVTALWEFDTQAGRNLLETFLTLWAIDGLAKADALAEAQRAMICGAVNTAWRHPFFWAPFMLSGDWL
jgi:CHAT domain-containing protein